MRRNRVDQTAVAGGAPRGRDYFALLAGIVNAFEVAPPPDGDPLPR